MLTLKPLPSIGDTVHCPTDRGDPSFYGTISHISETPGEHMGRSFYWITVRRSNGASGGVWPSHRLGYTFTV